MEQKLTYRIKLRYIDRGILQHFEWEEHPPRPSPPPFKTQKNQKIKVGNFPPSFQNMFTLVDRIQE